MGKLTTLNVQERIKKELKKNGVFEIKNADLKDLYFAISKVCKDELVEKQRIFNAKAKKSRKILHYISIEFLLGKSLKNNLYNLGIEKTVEKILKNAGKDVEDVYEVEKDAALGNGGLGRLAACYFDSLTTLGYSAYGHCILYEQGLFKQKIFEDGQIEIPDEWLSTGKIWLVPKPNESVVVRFEGKVNESTDYDGKFIYTYEDAVEVRAEPYDLLISGYKSDSISVLRLWSANNTVSLDEIPIGSEKYESYLEQKDEVESISKVLYPADHHEKGKSLRLKQQYFLVSSALQTAVRQHLENHTSLKTLPRFLVVHINDTHPAMSIPELMRILLDDYRFSWDDAWNIVTRTINYTNHTILQESLEVWRFDLFERKLPRIAMILKEIDRRYRIYLNEKFPNQPEKVEKMAIISKNSLRMANLCIASSKNVNGVAKIHTEILKNNLFKDFYELEPSKFFNVTNGISFRRWLAECNPSLHRYIQSEVKEDYLTNSRLLTKFKQIEKKPEKLNKLMSIKLENKKRLADYLKKHYDIVVDPKSRFDVQVKRIHEYKRQLLNLLKIIYLYSELLKNPNLDVTPQTFIFAGKSAPGYAVAKRIIQLILALSKDIDCHKDISKKLKVVFIEDYNVTLSEIIMPATDVTEQISLAGREASGTGNMKAVLNGALMLCTEDGANVEIGDKCGRNNHFHFGLSCDQVEGVWKKGYDPMKYFEQDERVQTVIKMLEDGFDGKSFMDIADLLLWRNANKDAYLNLADFDSYMKAHFEMDRVYKNKKEWAKKTLNSISTMGYFSSDRSVEQYVSKIWKI